MRNHRLNFHLALVFACLFCHGCATVTQQQQAEMDETAPLCYGEKDCEVKWAAARTWVLNNSKMKIQIYSDDLIETYNPPPDSPLLAARVTKIPAPNMKECYGISVYVWCKNMFGCVPDIHSAVVNFNNYINSIKVEDKSAYISLVKEADFERPVSGFIAPVINNKVIVKSVLPGSPAERAGLKAQDIIVKFGEQNVENITAPQFMDLLKKTKFDDKKKVQVIRNGQRFDLVIEFPSKEEVQNMAKSEGIPRPSKEDESMEQKLETLNRLLGKGLITQKEYDQKKKELLSNY